MHHSEIYKEKMQKKWTNGKYILQQSYIIVYTVKTVYFIDPLTNTYSNVFTVAFTVGLKINTEPLKGAFVYQRGIAEDLE